MPRHSMSPILGSRFAEAMSFALSLHATQLRKKIAGETQGHFDVPYVSHLMAVAALVVESGGNENEAMAALLHDAFEDGPDCLARKRCLSPTAPVLAALYQEIRQTVRTRFGNDVCAIVDSCSEDKSLSDKKLRKKNYLMNLSGASASAQLVAICDKIHNAESIALDLARYGEATWTKFSLGKDASLAFYAKALDIARGWNGDPRLPPLVWRFARAVDTLRTF